MGSLAAGAKKPTSCAGKVDLLKARQNHFEGFEIEPFPCHFRSLAVFGVEGKEAPRVPLGLIDPFEGIAFGFEDGALGHPARLGHLAVVLLPRLEDQTFLFLLGLVDLVGRGR
jgi:hypothetical protein